MDSLEPTPPKVRRINKHAAMHVSECVREFKLPVHFPGLVSGHKPVSKEHTITPSMTVLKTIETEPQTIDVGKKISKGKNVQLVECTDKKVIHQISSDKVLSGTNRSLSSPNSSKIKTLTNPMSNSLAINYNGVSKLKTLKLKSPDGKDLGEFQVELLDFKNQVQKRKLITIPTSALTSKDDSDNIVTSTQNDPIVSYSMKDVQYPGSIYQEPRIDKLENDLSSKVKIISNVSLNKLPADDLSKIIQGKQMIKTIFSNTPFEPPTISTKHLHPTDENSKKLLYLKPEEHPYLKSITKTGKPISLKPVKLKSLTLNLKPSEINDPNFTSGLSGYKNGDMDEDCEDELENEKIDSPKNESEQQQPKREWKKLEYTLTKKNVMVMLPKVSSNKKLMTNRRQSSESSLTTSEEDFTNLESDSPKQGKLAKSAKGKNSDKKRKENSEDVEFNQSVDISIVERALASVKDKTLRDEALKILASCKLGIERQIPIRPPSNEISVRDTTTQTDIFGNLERECEEFIEVKKSEKGIKRINKIMRDGTIAFKSLNSIVNPIKQYEEENNFSSQLDKMIMELDIDSNDKQEMTKIKNVLERPIQSVEKMNRVQMQIINDIKSLEICDEDGFTGLHKAIVRDDIKAVKRLLMILPMTKNNIDAKSYDNKTSLELAMKMDADPEIVNCLLEAGAKPTSEEVGYDSALLIACKNSSPLLPQLIKYACKTALDSMDVEGFGAIHICAVRGNSNAINSLIAAGANINLQDLRSGRTALFHAIENGHIDLARHLLASGAKPSIRNNDGHTILPLLDDPKTQILKNIVLKAMKSH